MNLTVCVPFVRLYPLTVMLRFTHVGLCINSPSLSHCWVALHQMDASVWAASVGGWTGAASRSWTSFDISCSAAYWWWNLSAFQCPKKIFILASFLKDTFNAYKILSWQYFFLLSFSRCSSKAFLLTLFLTKKKKICHFFLCFSICKMSFFSFAFKIFSLSLIWAIWL